MTSVERLDDGPLHVGSRARVKQPGMMPLIWEVTELRDQEVFTWATRSPVSVRSVCTVSTRIRTGRPGSPWKSSRPVRWPG